jgi:hypothetical protein
LLYLGEAAFVGINWLMLLKVKRVPKEKFEQKEAKRASPSSSKKSSDRKTPMTKVVAL